MTDKPDSMVERVALAIWERESAGVRLKSERMYSGYDVSHIGGPYNAEYFEHIARAAIEAMREPTEAVVGHGAGLTMSDASMTERWQAMIDAALGDKS